MSDDIDTNGAAIKVELRALGKELTSGLARIEARLDLMHSADVALDDRVRALELAQATEAGSKNKGREVLAAIAGVGGVIGAALTAFVQWLLGSRG